jgi:hypothetical protein
MLLRAENDASVPPSYKPETTRVIFGSQERGTRKADHVRRRRHDVMATTADGQLCRASGKGRRNPSPFHATSWALANLVSSRRNSTFLGFFLKKLFLNFFQKCFAKKKQKSDVHVDRVWQKKIPKK